MDGVVAGRRDFDAQHGRIDGGDGVEGDGVELLRSGRQLDAKRGGAVGENGVVEDGVILGGGGELDA